MDRIRAALGVRRINFYGWSYGTYLGQVYATLFPNRVRRMVLDSNVDPRKVWYAANLDQDRAFERNMGLFFGWLAKHDGTYHLGATGQAVQQRWYDARASLRDAPIAGQVGPDEWSDIFLNAGYAQFLWPDLGRLFADWVNGAAGAPVVDAYRSVNTPGDDNSYAAYVAVTCSEGRWKTHDWVADSRRLSATAPFLTWANTWFNAPCFYWPAPSHRPTHVRGKALGAALLVDETLDAATPYAGSLFVRSIDRRSRLVAVAGGTSHAVSPSGNACVDNKIFAYLKSGSLPPRRAGRGADVTCRAQPQPQPHDASPAFRAGSSATALARLALRGDLAASRHLLARLTLSPARS
jgi:pimeloyl-ACP methyl ester carboxylesterase